MQYTEGRHIWSIDEDSPTHLDIAGRMHGLFDIRHQHGVPDIH